jgi:hypothetical protein
MPAKPKAKRIGDIQTVANTSRRFGSAQEYHFVRLQGPNGTELPYLFTLAELIRATTRAQANPEDLLKAGIIQNLLD